MDKFLNEINLVKMSSANNFCKVFSIMKRKVLSHRRIVFMLFIILGFYVFDFKRDFEMMSKENLGYHSPRNPTPQTIGKNNIRGLKDGDKIEEEMEDNYEDKEEGEIMKVVTDTLEMNSKKFITDFTINISNYSIAGVSGNESFVTEDERNTKQFETESFGETQSNNVSDNLMVYVTSDVANGVVDQELDEYQIDGERIDYAVYNDIDLPANIEERADTNPPHKRGFPYNVLLLASMGRSGSSFLGELLNTQSKVIYFFEPLHDLDEKHWLNENSAVKAMRGIYTCNITNPILRSFQKDPNFYIKRYFKQCGPRKPCLTGESINTRCKEKFIKVAKTIRLRAEWLVPLLEDPDVNLKVIHLVRDPRASIISAWNRGWKTTADEACGLISQDLQFGLKIREQYPDKYMAVRYEDLCDEPWELAKIIFAFLGYENLPDSTLRFLKQSTTGHNSERAYGTKRNTRRMQQKWRSEITNHQLELIEATCETTIKDIGFSLFRNLNAVRNYSRPLYDNQTLNRFFIYHTS